MIRYSDRPFPSYRFVPGREPHPRRDPRGHSYDGRDAFEAGDRVQSGQRDQPVESPGAIDPADFAAIGWRASETYRYAIDLFNHRYWWEAHEALEDVWQALGRTTRDGRFVQGLIQVAAALLRHSMEPSAASRRKAEEGFDKLRRAPDLHMGVDVPALVDAVSASMRGEVETIPQIRLRVGPQGLLARLAALGLKTTTVTHPPVFTVEESKALRGPIEGCHTKNLFVRDKKGRMWLVVCLESRQVDLKAVAAALGARSLSFGSPERLMRYLGVIPGAVTPLGIVNDAGREVTVVLDEAILERGPLNFHPLDNAMTTTISVDDFLTFLEVERHPPVVLALSPPA